MSHYDSLALWSINERLAGRDGYDLEPPDTEWMTDHLIICQEDAARDRERNRGLHRDEREL